MPFHVKIERTSAMPDVRRMDLSEQHVLQRVVAPFMEGRSLFLGGMTIPPDDIRRLRIVHTEQDSEELRPAIQQQIEDAGLEGFSSVESEVMASGRDVTDDLVTGPPGEGISHRTHAGTGPDVQGPRVVFVVHGRNGGVRNSMFNFLRSIGLHPLEWSEAVMATGHAAPYVGEVLDTAFSIAQAVVVLMTPDDEARLREPFRQSGDPIHETQNTPQARPNVLFEAGMAMGRFPGRTVLVELGNLRPFSDIGGRHVIRINNTTQRRQELAQRLEAAGCPINLTGTDWHTAGDFVAEE